VIGAIKVRVPGGAEARDVEAVLRAVRRDARSQMTQTVSAITD
jgi:hypothetical protein